jgi:hypothetical protein
MLTPRWVSASVAGIALQPASTPDAQRSTPVDIDDWQERLAADDELVRRLAKP